MWHVELPAGDKAALRLELSNGNLDLYYPELVQTKELNEMISEQ